MTDTYPRTPTLEASKPQGFNKLLRPIAAAASIPLAAVGITSCRTESNPLPPRDSFIELQPKLTDRFIDSNNPLAGMHLLPEPEGGWDSQTRADQYHLSELVPGNKCTPKPGSEPVAKQQVKIGNFVGELQQKAANPVCANSFYARAETQTGGGTNTADFEVEERVIPADPTEPPYRVRQESIAGEPHKQAWTVMNARKVGDRIIACIVSDQQEVCLKPFVVGQPTN